MGGQWRVGGGMRWCGRAGGQRRVSRRVRGRVRGGRARLDWRIDRFGSQRAGWLFRRRTFCLSNRDSGGEGGRG